MFTACLDTLTKVTRELHIQYLHSCRVYVHRRAYRRRKYTSDLS